VKIAIIAIDALEYTLVKRWRLKNLMQAEYGKVTVNVAPQITPTLWASFLTGSNPHRHGVYGWRWSWGDRVKALLLKCKFHSLTKHSQWLWVFLGKILDRLGCKLTISRVKTPTFLDYTRSIAVNVPCYSSFTSAEALRHKIIHVMGDKKKEKIAIKEAYAIFRSKARYALRKLNEEWRIFMIYFYIADFIQHVRFCSKKSIYRLYKELDHLVGEFKKHLSPDTLLLVISDHGMKRGIHTDYGFYSLSKRLNLKEPKITDFYRFIGEWLNA